MSQLINQSVGQSTSQPVGQTVTQSVGQLLSKSVNQSVSQLVRQLGSQSINHLVNQKICQTVNQLVSLAVGQPVKWIEQTPLEIRILHNLCTPWSKYLSARHINQHSVHISVKILTKMQPICWWIYRPIYRVTCWLTYRLTISQYFASMAVNTRSIRWSLNVGGISVNCRWYIDQLPYNTMCFRLFLKASSVLEMSSTEMNNFIQMKKPP